MKNLKKIFVFLLILICPIFSACSLDPSRLRDSKYGPIKLRESNVENYVKGFTSRKPSLSGNEITFDFDFSLLDKIKGINETVKITMMVSYFITFKNNNGETEYKKWKDIELVVSFDVHEYDEDDSLDCFVATMQNKIVYSGVKYIYSGGIEFQYYIDAEGEIFIPRPPDDPVDSGEVVES